MIPCRALVKQAKGRQAAASGAMQKAEVTRETMPEGIDGNTKGGSKKSLSKQKVKAAAGRGQKRSAGGGLKDKATEPVQEAAQMPKPPKRKKADLVSERNALKVSQEEVEALLSGQQAKLEETQDRLEQLNEQKHALVIKLKQARGWGEVWSGNRPPWIEKIDTRPCLD